MNRQLAHSYYDEIVAKRQARPYSFTWRHSLIEGGKLIAQSLAVLLFGCAFLLVLWLVAR